MAAFGVALTVLIGGGVTSPFAAVSGISGRAAELFTIAEAFAVVSLFAAGLAVAPVAASSVGVSGMIDAILSFSTSTNPKSVFTLNMLSSYATITPCSFFPSVRGFSSAGAALKQAPGAAPAKLSAKRPGIQRGHVTSLIQKVWAASWGHAFLPPPVVSGVPTPPGCPQFAGSRDPI